MANLHMKLGENMGDILLDIAKNRILKGEPEGAIQTYSESLFGILEEYIIKILKNEAVLKTSDNGVEMDFSDDPELIEKNKSNILDWFNIIKQKDDELRELTKTIYQHEIKFSQAARTPISDFNLMKYGERQEDGEIHAGIHHIIARLLANNPFTHQKSNGESIWQRITANIQADNACTYERVYYHIVKYVQCIKYLAEDYRNLAKMYNWLREKDIINHMPFIERNFERSIQILDEFANPNTGFHHPMCDEEISDLKENIVDIIMDTKWGKEYFLYGATIKNILDGYDAGWLSPTGEFFADLGEVSNMIHMKIAEKLFTGKGNYGEEMRKDGVSLFSSNSPEQWLTKKGWIKIHHQDVYGSFFPKLNDEMDYAYCPTTAQIQKICEYVDTFYGGKFYTEYGGMFPRHSHPEPYSTYQVRQMDKPMLHKIFSF